jgi:hypothetical protein
VQAFKSFRTLRVLRPLRMIARNEGLKLVVNAIFMAIPAISNVIFVIVLVFLLFGAVAVSFFKGSFNSCQVCARERGCDTAVMIKCIRFLWIHWPQIHATGSY